MKYHIERFCRMRFDNPVREHHIQIRLAPWNDESQSLIRIRLLVEPDAQTVGTYDCFGNLAHHFAILRPHRELAFSLVAEVETRREDPLDFEPVPPTREMAWIRQSLRQAPRLWDFVLHRGALTPGLPSHIGGREVPALQEGSPLIRQVQDAMGWVGGIACFDATVERSAPNLRALIDQGRGTAADLSHLLIALVRHWGVPARFVSGYLDAAAFDAADGSRAHLGPHPQRLHHWVEVLIPGGDWRGLDPSLGRLADTAYMRVAIGRDASDIQPVRQACKGVDQEPEMDQDLMVSRIPS